MASDAHFRFWLPSSVRAEARGRAGELEALLGRELGLPVQVQVASDYERLCSDLLSGRADAAWAPPYVCAKLEAMATRVLVRAVRNGASTYRAALLRRADEPFGLSELGGKRAAWVDRESVGGYLLAAAHLKSQGIDPAKTFFSQTFAGSYDAAIRMVVSKEADLTSIYAPTDGQRTGLEEVLPEASQALATLAFTGASPNDGVAVSTTLKPRITNQLEGTLERLHTSPQGRDVLKVIFNAERFEPAPKLSYRGLYQVAMAGC